MSLLALAKGWFTVSTNAESLCCVIVYIVANSTLQPAEADVTLKILDDHSWVVFIRGRRASERGRTQLSSPLVVTDGASIRTIIDNLERSQICIGNPDECWHPLSQKRKDSSRNLEMMKSLHL